MTVKCISNSGGSLPKSMYEYYYNVNEKTKFDQLIIGGDYLVYSICFIKGNPWYLIFYEHSAYPYYHPFYLFEITDSRMSKYWIIGEQKDEYDNEKKSIVISFKEMVNDEYFYGRLLEDDIEVKKIFEEYRRKLLLEFYLEN